MKLKDHYFDWISSEDYELDLKRQAGVPLGRVSDPLEGVKIFREYPRYSKVRKRLVERFKASGTSTQSFKGKLKMELAIIVYLISVLSKMSILTIVILSFALVGLITSIFAYTDGYCDEDFWAKCFKKSLVVGAVSAVVFMTIPSEKTMYTMAGAYAAQQVVQNPEVQKLSGKVLQVIETKLDSYVEDTASKVDKAVKN